MYKILEKREMAEKTVCHLKVEAPRIARKAKPGQFVVLRVNETGERIPLTMAGTDPAAGTIDLIFQVVGKSTALMRTLNVGDSLLDLIGPLGKPTHVENLGTVDLCGRRNGRRGDVSDHESLQRGGESCDRHYRFSNERPPDPGGGDEGSQS